MRNRRSMTAAVLTAACLLAGCTSGADEGAGSTTTRTPAPTSTAASTASPLEGRWATGPIPIDDLRQALVTAGITPQDAAGWVTEVGAPSTYSFVLDFTGDTFTHSEETPDMPMQVGESGSFTLTGDRLLLRVPASGGEDTYTLGLSKVGDTISLRWIDSTESGSPENKAEHRRFTIAFYCAAPFTRVA